MIICLVASIEFKDIPQKLVKITEGFLTWRLRRKLKQKEDKKKKHFLIDWIETFVSSAFIVLLINQYLFQAYVIPSGSMKPTLEEQDRIFVNKLVYGPELLPGMFKIPSPISPVRGDIIIFESPQYLNPLRGTFFDLAQRMIFMLSLSLIDIDRDDFGNPRIRFLIKRGPVVGGDRARFVRGNLQIMPRGWDEWTEENAVKRQFGLQYPSIRDVPPGIDAFYRDAAKNRARIRLQRQREGLITTEGQENFSDTTFELVQLELENLMLEVPHLEEYRRQYFRHRSGMFIPEGWILPLGDNRDHSLDGRYFGPVKLDKILGQAAFKFWPPGRIGGIH
jgi:signal peptidase I